MNLERELRRLYDLQEEHLSIFPEEDGKTRSVLVSDEKTGVKSIIRVSRLMDNSVEDFEAEAEFVHFLANNQAPTTDVIKSKAGNYVEVLQAEKEIGDLAVCRFSWAKGDNIADHGYHYVPGSSISDYWFQCGRAIGKIHALSKNYLPQHSRYDFFSRYKESYIDRLIPTDFKTSAESTKDKKSVITAQDIKRKMSVTLNSLRRLLKTPDNYGMVHMDFTDRNYAIDYSTGAITVSNFGNCCNFFYMYDLASIWTQGFGWTAWEIDPAKRKQFMNDYFNVILKGYRSETTLSEQDCDNLPVFIQALLMCRILNKFDAKKAEGERAVWEEEDYFPIRIFMEEAPYMGFFSTGDN